MHLTSYLEDGKLTIELTGEIDHHSAKQYMDAIAAKLEAYRPGLCILDFSSVLFMDSSGIALVIRAFRAMSRLSGKLLLSGLKDQPLRVFRASGVDKLVQIVEVMS